MRFFASCLLALGLAACDGGSAPTDAGAERPVILEVRAPAPAVEGSVIEVRGLGLDRLGLDARLAIERAGAPISTLDTIPDEGDGRRLFLLSADAVTQLGGGIHDLEVVALGNELESEPFAFTLRLVTTLPVDLFDTPSGEVHRNDVAVLNGNGIIGTTEGTLEAHFVGIFTLDAGGSSGIDVRLTVTPLERTSRERGVVILSTDLGGLFPGTFDGTIQLRSRLLNGEQTESATLATSLHFNPPDLYSLDPTNAAVGQFLTVSGAGFLGGSEHPDEATLLRLEGMFEPVDAAPVPFGPMEIVPRWLSGSAVQLVIEPAVRRDQIASELFGYAQGVFMGRATPITIKGVEELEGASVPFGFVLGAVVQVVYVRFLPSFYTSLGRYGLASAAPEIEAAVQARMEAIYAPWNVDLRFEEPQDFSRTAYSVLEIGGPDPNGVGLFGYDNTPGKDIGNLRLFDSIGGTNAETQADGYPGYGGVFVESFLYWSSHPDLPGERPLGAPDAEPLFDEVFDPVRLEPATRPEARGEADPARAEAVRRAIDALSSIIGETAAHEIGHSLGMAQPFGSPTVYHNDFDGEGCLMDSGGDRALGERMALPGFTATHFCYDHPDYLSEILGR